MHSLTTVQNDSVESSVLKSKLVWTKVVSAGSKDTSPVSTSKFGFYIFGGANSKKEPQNDIYFIRPYYKMNAELLDGKKLEFQENTQPRLYIEIFKLEPSGKPPCPRYLHTAQFINKYIYIFGGRNDKVYKSLKNSALNDLHLYDVENNKWTTVALYGQIPMSRWGHCMTKYRDSLMIFGGKNLKRFAHTTLHYLITSKQFS